MSFKFLKFCVILLAPFFAYGQTANVKALKTEYLINPLGLDNPNPRFTWQMEDNRIGAKQTAYRILVNTDSIALTQGRAYPMEYRVVGYQ